jgi:phosphopantothenate synthetase
MLVDEFHRVVSKRLKELFKDFDHAKRENYKDIVSHLDYSHTITKELLERAKKYQKRDMEAKKK